MNQEEFEENIIKNLRKETQNIKLSPEEKARIFEHVMHSPTPSPYAPKRSTWHFTSKTLVYVFASFLIVVLSGSTLAHASLKSVPGESLYTIKRKITEPVLDTLAFTPALRAERKAEKAIRRLNEAEKLALKDGFTAERRLELEKSFEKNKAEFETAVEAIPQISVKEKEALKKSFEASLSAHTDVLQKVQDRKNNEEKKKENKKERKEQRKAREKDQNEEVIKFKNKIEENKAVEIDTDAEINKEEQKIEVENKNDVDEDALLEESYRKALEADTSLKAELRIRHKINE